MVVEWPYRTTVGFHDTRGWEVIELCEKLFDMENRAAALPGKYQRLLTILSKSVLNVADFGMVILDVGSSGDASGSAERPAVASTGVEPMQDVAVSTLAVATEERRDSIGVALPQTIAVEPSPNTVQIAGVTVNKTSAISVLKAACGYLQVSQSGSKAKLWRRILDTLDKQAINAERELAAIAFDETKRKAESVQVSCPPTDQSVIDEHLLTHLPYAAWCPACAMSKGRPEYHPTDPSRPQRR